MDSSADGCLGCTPISQIWPGMAYPGLRVTLCKAQVALRTVMVGAEVSVGLAQGCRCPPKRVAPAWVGGVEDQVKHITLPLRSSPGHGTIKAHWEHSAMMVL
jgi:hypothetical protein